MKRYTFVTLIFLLLGTVILAACTGTPGQSPTATTVVQPTEAAGPAAMQVRVATDATWPPFEIVDEASKEIVGFDIDLFNAIAEKAGLEVEYINVSWDPLLAGVSQCQYDAAISAMTITEERKASMLFSDPYLSAGQIIAVTVNNSDINGPADLAGKTAGAQIGTTGAIEIEKIEGVTLKTYDTVDLAYLDLINGQVDAVVADYPTAINFVKRFEDKIKTTGEVFTDENYGIAVCQQKPELLERINMGLAAVKADNLIPELETKWLEGQGQ